MLSLTQQFKHIAKKKVQRAFVKYCILVSYRMSSYKNWNKLQDITQTCSSQKIQFNFLSSREFKISFLEMQNFHFIIFIYWVPQTKVILLSSIVHAFCLISVLWNSIYYFLSVNDPSEEPVIDNSGTRLSLRRLLTIYL